ncbi:MAG TPA: ATP-binding protein [Acidimicrobiales bacterium]|jgi:signal transduction histidine kinase|nr:ATP-binding protein [Acidimicrobiales bacterium]
MNVRRTSVAVVIAALVLALIFAVFGVELAANQQRSRSEIKTEVHDRSVLAAALMDSLFQTVEEQTGTDTQYYGGSVDQSQLDKAAAGEAYALVMNSSGQLISASTGFSAEGGFGLDQTILTRIAHGSALYFLGDLTSYNGSPVADLVVKFPDDNHGSRLLVTGLKPQALAAIFDGELRSIPGVRGESNYLLDSAGRTIASSLPNPVVGAKVSDLPSSGAASRDVHGSYEDQAVLSNSGWRVLQTVPDGPLFASVSGTREYLPWLILVALVAVAIIAGALAWRVLRSAEVVRDVNARLAGVNEELSAANESLQRRAAELARSNEELDSFASIASHDLQEPLRKVRTFTEQLSVTESANLSDKGRDYLARTNAAAERMQRLIEDLLRFSRVSTQGRPFETVDLADVAARVVQDLEAQIDDAGGRVEIGALPVITADPLQMQQLLQNLISNGLKFRRPEAPPVVNVTGRIEEGMLQLRVSDNGIGFEPRYAARIFRIFERLHGRNEYPGTGIGLALCRKIADRHGGTIEAESEPGQGATFKVSLPVYQPEGAFGFGLDLESLQEAKARARV